MTFREKATLEHPDYFNDGVWGGVLGCPCHMGYENHSVMFDTCTASPENCRACWDREIPEVSDMSIRDMVNNEIVPDGSVTINVGPHILDSGERRQFDSGAVRDIQEGKGRCDLMPLDVVAEHINDNCLHKIYKFETDGRVCHLYSVLETFSLRYGAVTEPLGRRAAMYLDAAHQFEDGAKKYGEHNWQKGIPAYCYIDSAVRHYLKLLAGWTDEPHDRAFVWNLMCCIWTCEHKPELNTYAGDRNDE